MPDKFWEPKAKVGPKFIFETPDALWNACIGYFEWVEENPLSEQKIYNGEYFELRKARAMTIKGLHLYLGIHEKTWHNYREREEYKEVCARVQDIIYTQKFELAAADLLNVQLIARDLGLKEKSEQEVTVTPYAVSGEPEENEEEWLNKHKPK